MTCTRPGFNSLTKWLLLFSLILFPGYAMGQSKKPSSAPRPAAPAPHAPAASHPTSSAERPGGATTANHGEGVTTANHGGVTTANHGGVTTTGGSHATTTSARTGETTGGAKGGTTSAGRTGAPGAAHPPTRTVTTRSGATARVGANGRVTSIRTANGTRIDRGPNGSRRVESRLPDHGRLVSMGRHGGYAEHPYRGRDGRPYMRRTYYYHGRAYAYGYRGYYYHGGYYYGYVPPYYYRPAFYGWAYNPWAAPVVYSWGWGGAPWYGYYGYYFNPYPVYATAALWMTDYIISQNLQAAYDAQAAANANAAAAAQAHAQAQSDASAQTPDGGGGGVALTPEVKQAIADEVKAQLAAEQSAAAAPAPTAAPAAQAAPAQDTASTADATPPEETPAALDPNHRTFIVSTVLSEPGPNGQDCSLSPGDVVTRIEDTPDANKDVKVLVSASQKSDCPSGSQVAMSVDDLQEMHNHFREQLDSGLKNLADNQGKNGLPSAPAAGGHANPDGQVQPDSDVKEQLASQQADADKAEGEAQQEASSTGSSD